MNEVYQNMHNPIATDTVGHRPTLSDLEGQRPTLSDADKMKKNLTVKEVEKLLAAAGFPRDERSIQRYCKQGSLDGEQHPDDHQYYISLASEEKLIQRFQEAQSRRAFGPFVAGGPAVSDGIRHATTPPRQERDEEVAQPQQADAATIKEFEDKLFNLEVDKRATEKVNNILRDQMKEDRKMYSQQISENREMFFQQLQEIIKELNDTKQLVGELQMQVKQVAAPKSEPAAVEPVHVERVTEAEIIEDMSLAAPQAAPAAASSLFPHNPFAENSPAEREESSETQV
jgi:TolA-binding protein